MVDQPNVSNLNSPGSDPYPLGTVQDWRAIVSPSGIVPTTLTLSKAIFGSGYGYQLRLY